MIKRPIKWTRQPRIPVGIDWSNPALVGALSVVIPVLHGNIIVFTRNGVFRTTSNMPEVFSSDGVRTGSVGGGFSTINTGPSITGSRTVFSYSHNSEPSDSVAYNCFSHSDIGTDSNKDGLAGRFQTLDGTFYTSRINVKGDVKSVAVWDSVANTGTLYVKGAEASVATTNTHNYNTNRYQIQGLSTRGVYYGIVFPSVIPEAQRNLLITQNPWQIFAPQNRNIYTEVIDTGSKNLSPSLYSDTDDFLSPTVTTSYSISPSLFSDGDTFYSATVSSEYNITPSLFSDADTFYSPIVGIDGGDQALLPTLFTDSDTFYSPTVTGDQALLPALFTDTDIFYSPTVTNPGAMTLTQADIDAISNAVWAKAINGLFTAAQMQRIMFASLAGKRAGIGTATEIYFDPSSDTTPRVTFTPTDANGNGTPVVTP